MKRRHEVEVDNLGNTILNRQLMLCSEDLWPNVHDFCRVFILYGSPSKIIQI